MLQSYLGSRTVCLDSEESKCGRNRSVVELTKFGTEKIEKKRGRDWKSYISHQKQSCVCISVCMCLCKPVHMTQHSLPLISAPLPGKAT